MAAATANTHELTLFRKLYRALTPKTADIVRLYMKFCAQINNSLAPESNASTNAVSAAVTLATSVPAAAMKLPSQSLIGATTPTILTTADAATTSTVATMNLTEAAATTSTTSNIQMESIETPANMTAPIMKNQIMWAEYTKLLAKIPQQNMNEAVKLLEWIPTMPGYAHDPDFINFGITLIHQSNANISINSESHVMDVVFLYAPEWSIIADIASIGADYAEDIAYVYLSKESATVLICQYKISDHKIIKSKDPVTKTKQTYYYDDDGEHKLKFHYDNDNNLLSTYEYKNGKLMQITVGDNYDISFRDETDKYITFVINVKRNNNNINKSEYLNNALKHCREIFA